MRPAGGLLPLQHSERKSRASGRGAADRKIDFELIDDAFKALLKSDPVVADRIADLRDRFCDAFAGWLGFEEAA
jgi:hypothetical protein